MTVRTAYHHLLSIVQIRIPNHLWLVYNSNSRMSHKKKMDHIGSWESIILSTTWIRTTWKIQKRYSSLPRMYIVTPLAIIEITENGAMYVDDKMYDESEYCRLVFSSTKPETGPTSTTLFRYCNDPVLYTVWYFVFTYVLIIMCPSNLLNHYPEMREAHFRCGFLQKSVRQKMEF